MSVHERTDIECQGTEPVTDLKRSIRAILDDEGGDPGARSKRAPGMATAGSVSKGRGPVAHKNRGRVPPNATTETLQQQVVTLLNTN